MSGRKRRCELVISGERCRLAAGHAGRPHAFGLGEIGDAWAGRCVACGELHEPEDRPDGTIKPPAFQALSEGYEPMGPHTGALLVACALTVIAIVAWLVWGCFEERREEQRQPVEETSALESAPEGGLQRIEWHKTTEAEREALSTYLPMAFRWTETRDDLEAAASPVLP